MSMIDRWESAEELYFAVDKFAGNALREKFRLARGEREYWSIKQEMYLALFERLASGELEAFGVMLMPIPGSEIAAIPAHVFTEWPVVTDCEKNVVSTGTRKYESVRVREADSVSEKFVDDGDSQSLKPGKRGPKPLDPLIAEAVRVLEAGDALLWQRSQEKQIEIIRSKVAEMNPGRFPNRAKPGHTTIHRYLKKRQ